MYFFLWKVLEMIFYSQSGTFHTCQVFTASFCINLLPHIFFFVCTEPSPIPLFLNQEIWFESERRDN